MRRTPGEFYPCQIPETLRKAFSRIPVRAMPALVVLILSSLGLNLLIEQQARGTELEASLFAGLGAAGAVAAYLERRRSRGPNDGDPGAESPTGIPVTILELSDQPFVVADASRKPIWCNPAFERLTGYTADDLLAAESSREITPPEWRENERRALEELDRTCGPVRYEKEYIRKDGSRVQVELVIQLLKDAESKPELYFAFFIDITERKNAEKALERERDILQTVMNGAGNSHLAYLDAEFNFVRVNEAYARSCGHRPEEMIGKNHFALYPHAQNRAIFERVRDTGLPFEIRDKPFEFPDQPERGITWWDWTLTPVPGPDGKMAGLVLSLIETTARREAERERESAVEFLRLIHGSTSTAELVKAAVEFLHGESHCEAVGIRLAEGNDFPYFESRGFPPDFLEQENRLCVPPDDQQARDEDGDPALACMCGTVIRGQTDPSLPFFTPGGSFWTNSTGALMASAAEEGRPAMTRNRCCEQGYESVALIPLRSGNECLGLIQFNDTRIGRFTVERIAFWERLAAYLAVGLARSRAEENLRAGHERTVNILESIGDGFLSVDRETRVTYVNARGAHLLGKSREDMLNRTLSELFPEDEASVFRNAILRAMTEGVSVAIEEFYPPLGAWFESHLYPTADGASAFFQDITERKRAQEEIVRLNQDLHRKVAEMETIFTTAPIGLAIAEDPEGLHIRGNPANERLLGAPSGGELSKRAPNCARYRPFLGDKPLPPDELPMQRAVRGETVLGQEIEVVREDGNKVVLQASAVPLYDEGGKPRGAVGAFADVTERRHQETELQRLNRTLRALSSSNHALMRAQSEDSYLREVCHIVVRDCGHATAFISFVEEDEARTIRPRAGYGVDQAYLDGLHLSWAEDEYGRGPTGTAVRTGRPCVCRDMLNDPAYAPWRDRALERGFASSLALPLEAEGRCFGALTICSFGHDSFSDEEVTLLRELANDLAYGISMLRLRNAHERSEEALRESEVRLNRAQEIARLGSLEYDVAAQRLTASDEAYRVFGLRPGGRVSRKTFLSLVHPEDRQTVQAAWFYALRNRKDTVEVEHRILRKHTEEVRWIHQKWVHLRSASGRVVRSYGMLLDITERKRAEQRLDLLAGTASALLRTDTPQSVIETLCRKVLDFVDAQCFFNFLVQDRPELFHAGEQIQGGDLHLNSYAGISPEEAETIRWLGFGTGVCGCVAREGQRLVLHDVDRSENPRDATVRSFGIRAYACHPLISKGRVVGTISFGTRNRPRFSEDELALMKAVADQVAIALERQRAEEALRRLNAELELRVEARTADLAAANKELEAFCYSVSHDLRAPLRTMDGFSLAVLEDYSDTLDGTGRDYLNRVRSGCQHMGRLIDDLLNLSRLSRAEPRRQRIDLSAMAADAIRLLGESQPGRTVETVIAPGLTAEGDPDLLRSALWNLLENAWKFTSRQAEPRIEFGVLERRTEDGGAFASLRPRVFFVRDNGAGFDMAYAQKLFQPFQRLHGAAEFPGIGIGLANVQRIIHRHGGNIWAAGGIDQGAVFYFTLDPGEGTR